MREKSFRAARRAWCFRERRQALKPIERWASALDRKSTRLNSSHSQISYAVFCLKKKKKHSAQHPTAHTYTTSTSDFHPCHTYYAVFSLFRSIMYIRSVTHVHPGPYCVLPVIPTA